MHRRATATFFLFAVVCAVFLPIVAGAHAAYKESDPADESTVASAPAEVWAEFTEPPSDASYMEVHDACGQRVDAGDSRPDGYRLYVSMAADRAGEYRVTFFVNSEVDTHNTRGEFTFTARSGEGCPNEEADGGRDQRAASGDASGPRDSQGTAGGGGFERESKMDVAAPGGRRREGDRRGPDSKAGGPRAGPVAQAPSPQPRPPDEPSPFSGIPLGAFVAGLGISAAIGAAGGLIYAGIMGYGR